MEGKHIFKIFFNTIRISETPTLFHPKFNQCPIYFLVQSILLFNMSNSKSRWIIFLPGDKYDNNQQPQAYGCNQYIQNDEAEVQWLDGRTSKCKCKI